MSVTIPADFAARCGWYDGPAGRFLLSQVPESYFGEPMILVSSEDRVDRFYPVDDRHLRGDDGTLLDLDSLTRSSRYLEQQVHFEACGVQLAGTIITPATPGPHPAAVFVHGAAGGQRDFNRLFAQPLLDAGVAVLIYDKAGHGLSGGIEPTIFDQRDAASAALDLLARQPGLDAGRIGLAGVSNGMWAVPMVAGCRSDVAFVAGIGSPGVSMAQSEVHRRVKALRDSGVGETTLAAVARAWRCIFAIAASGTAGEALVAELGEAVAQVAESADLSRYVVPGFARENPMLSPIPPPLPMDDLVEMLSGDPNPELMHDPVPDYVQVSCPVFLQFGADDTSVPVEASVERITDALQKAGVPHTIRVYPELEHLLNVIPPEVPGASREAVIYAFHDFRFGAAVRQDLTNWLINHLTH
jgi:dienelactone hydrolase